MGMKGKACVEVDVEASIKAMRLGGASRPGAAQRAARRRTSGGATQL